MAAMRRTALNAPPRRRAGTPLIASVGAVLSLTKGLAKEVGEGQAGHRFTRWQFA